jgi:hypothetical protein
MTLKQLFSYSFIIVVLVIFRTFSVAHAQDSHPRLWLTTESLAQYRVWANDNTRFWSESLLPLAEQARADMDAGNITNGDFGGYSYEDYPHENVAMLFAFMSLVHPIETERIDYAERARTLLMVVMNEAVKGEASGEPFRDRYFSLSDRSRWYGVGFSLTVDWIYPFLSAEDKTTIRTVFLRWMQELETADTTTMNHPEPVGVVNDPILVQDVDAVRWSGNNYYTAHMRNMGMMALAFDPADDPDGALQAYLQQAIGAWLYVNDHLMRTEASGGFGTEGFEYSPQSIGYTAQFLLALHTAGYDDPAQYGQQVSFTTNAFWDACVEAYFHSLSPATANNPDYDEPVYQPAWYGSGQEYLLLDPIEWFGAIGVYDALTNNTQRLNAVRWLQTNVPMGGETLLLDRSNDASEYHKAILYFMLFDPAMPALQDPRPAYPTTFYADGMRRLLSRTDWTESASWFTYSLSWNRVDHQTGNGNAIEFYRQGEWLTKIHVGYDLDYITSDHLNTLTVQNDPIDRDDYRLMISERGSQWLYSANNPVPPLWADSAQALFVYGDSTNLYNTDYEGLTGVSHVSRSIVWLKPDVIVIYDRAQTISDNRTKRFVLNLPNEASVNGNQINMTTANGQQFSITSLLPTNAQISVNLLQDEVSAPPARFDGMNYRLEVNGGGAAQVNFLHVLNGYDNGASAIATSLLTTTNPNFEGVIVGNDVVLFAKDMALAFDTLSYTTSAQGTHYISGLVPNGGYDLIISPDKTTIQIVSGTTYVANAAGVITFDVE